MSGYHKDTNMGLLQQLLDSASADPALLATDVAAGPRFTAITAAPRATDVPAVTAGNSTAAPRPVTGGVAYTDRGEREPGFDARRVTEAIRPGVLGQPLARLTAPLSKLGSRPPSASDMVAPYATGPTPWHGLDVAAASLNALLAAQLAEGSARLGDENGLDLIARLGKGRRLAIVGRFPYLQSVRLEASQSWVLELTPEDDEVPASAAADILPQADVVGITGSTLVNGTLEGLLALCRRDAFVAVIGPTSPLSPVLFEFGVDVICGAIVDDPVHVLESVAAGVTTRRLPGMRTVSFRP